MTTNKDLGDIGIGSSALTGNGSVPLVSNSSQTLWVDPVNGDDTVKTENVTSSNSLKTVQEAIDRVPRLLRHDWTINIADGETHSEDVIIQGIHAIGGEQSGGSSGHATLAIQGDTANISAQSLNSVTAIGCTGLQPVIVRGFQLTGSSAVEDPAGLLFLGCTNVEVSDMAYASDSGNNACTFYSSDGKVTGTQDLGTDNRSDAFVAKRGATMSVTNASVTGSTTNNIYQSSRGGEIFIASNTSTSATSTNQRDAETDGLVYDGSRNDFTAGVERRRGARVSQSSTQSISSGSVTEVSLGNVIHDDASLADTTNNRITADEFGRYEIKGVVTLGSVSDGTQVDTLLQVNGTNEAKARQHVGAAGQQIVETHTHLNLSSGDNVTLNVFHDEGSSLDTVAASINTYLSVQRIG